MSRRAEAAAASLEAVRAQTDAARAQESGARTMLGYTRLVRPFAGVVTARMADPGTMAAPGVPLLQVDQAAALQLQAAVDESAIGAIHKGMKVQVAIDGERHPVRLSCGHSCRDCSCGRSIEPQLSRQDRPAILKPDARGHVWNSRVRQWRHGRRSSFRAPPSLLRGSLNCVYVLDGQGIAQLRYITSGRGTGQSRRSAVGRFRRRKTR